MKLLVDMNLPPEWVPWLEAQGFEAVHWSSVGDIRAPDEELMRWARERDCVVFTHDLDFGTTLAHTKARGPSVFQVRTPDVRLTAIGTRVVRELRAHEEALAEGALVTVSEARARVRILPI